MCAHPKKANDFKKTIFSTLQKIRTTGYKVVESVLNMTELYIYER